MIDWFDRTFGEPWAGIIMAILLFTIAGAEIYLIATSIEKNSQVTFERRLAIAHQKH